MPWLEAKENSDHALWIRWNQGDRLKFLGRWERALAILDGPGLVKRDIVRMLKNPDQFLDTIAQLEAASHLLTKGFEIELEARKLDKITDIFLVREGVCIEVKNLHVDAMLLEQALTGNAKVVWLKDRLPAAVVEKYPQLPDGYANIIVIIAPPEVQFDEFEDLFIDIATTVNITTGEITKGKPKGLFYQESIDGAKLYAKMSATVMWKDHERKYLLNQNAQLPISERLLKRIVS